MTIKEAHHNRLVSYLVVAIAVLLLVALLYIGRTWLLPAATFTGSHDAATLCPGDEYTATWTFKPNREPFQAVVTIAWERVSPDPQKYAGRMAGTFSFLGIAGESKSVTVQNLVTPRLASGEYRMRVIAVFSGGAIAYYEVPVTIPRVCPIPPVATPQPLPAPAGTK